MGISGANAIDAETGSVFVTENEGNIRCVTSMPRVHIVIAGIEKIVPTLTDGLMVVKADSASMQRSAISTATNIWAAAVRSLRLSTGKHWIRRRMRDCRCASAANAVRKPAQWACIRRI